MKQPRAYNTVTGELLPVVSIWWGDDGSVRYVTARKDDTVDVWFDNFILEKNTGHTDKNGDELFAGDIVKADDVVRECEIQIEGATYTIDMQKGCWVVRNNDGWDFLQTNCNRLTKIGTIHDKEGD